MKRLLNLFFKARRINVSFEIQYCPGGTNTDDMVRRVVTRMLSDKLHEAGMVKYTVTDTRHPHIKNIKAEIWISK